MPKITFRMLLYPYIAAAVLTWGWIASDPCPFTYKDGICGPRDTAFMAGIMGGYAWPLYWTYKGFQILRAPQAQGE